MFNLTWMVSGLIRSRSPWRRALGITPGRVANSARSAQFTFGRRGCRRCRTANWWRRIKISAVLHASSRRDSRSHAASRVIRRNTNRRHMIGDHRDRSAGRATLLVRAADGILGTHRNNANIGGNICVSGVKVFHTAHGQFHYEAFWDKSGSQRDLTDVRLGFGNAGRLGGEERTAAKARRCLSSTSGLRGSSIQRTFFGVATLLPTSTTASQPLAPHYSTLNPPIGVCHSPRTPSITLSYGRTIHRRQRPSPSTAQEAASPC